MNAEVIMGTQMNKFATMLTTTGKKVTAKDIGNGIVAIMNKKRANLVDCFAKMTPTGELTTVGVTQPIKGGSVEFVPNRLGAFVETFTDKDGCKIREWISLDAFKKFATEGWPNINELIADGKDGILKSITERRHRWFSSGLPTKGKYTEIKGKVLEKPIDTTFIQTKGSDWSGKSPFDEWISAAHEPDNNRTFYRYKVGWDPYTYPPLDGEYGKTVFQVLKDRFERT